MTSSARDSLGDWYRAIALVVRLPLQEYVPVFAGTDRLVCSLTASAAAAATAVRACYAASERKDCLPKVTN